MFSLSHSAPQSFEAHGDDLGLLSSFLYTPLVWAFELNTNDQPLHAQNDGSHEDRECTSNQLGVCPDSTGASTKTTQQAESIKTEQVPLHTRSTTEEAATHHAVAVLTLALSKLSTLCPYLAAQIVGSAKPSTSTLCGGGDDEQTNSASRPANSKEEEEPSPSSPWTYYAPYKRAIPLFVNDLTLISEGDDNPFPSFQELREKHFPVSMLDGEKLFSSLAGIPSLRDPSAPRPVLIVQLNVVEGGLLLGVAGEHSVMDGGGLAAVLKLFDRLCCEASHEIGDFSLRSPKSDIKSPISIDDELVKTINMDRRVVVADILHPFSSSSEANRNEKCDGIQGKESKAADGIEHGNANARNEEPSTALKNLTPALAAPSSTSNNSDDVAHVGESTNAMDETCDEGAPASAPAEAKADLAIWAIFRFSAQSQKELKDAVVAYLKREEEAKQQCENRDSSDSMQPSNAFVSTNDVLTAFLWQSVMRARSERFEELRSTCEKGSEETTTFGRAVDVRSIVKPHSRENENDDHHNQSTVSEGKIKTLSSDYPGNMTLHTYSSLGIRQLVGCLSSSLPNEQNGELLSGEVLQGLSLAAKLLRSDLVEAKSVTNTRDGFLVQLRELLHIIGAYKKKHEDYYSNNKTGESPSSAESPLPPPSHVGVYPGARLKLQTNDLIFSSWSALPCYSMTFGLGKFVAKPLAVRRPNFMPYAGLMYFLPANTTPGNLNGGSAAGSIDTLVSLSARDIELLRCDPIFSRFANWIG